MPLRYFADTFYFIALLSKQDASHSRAVELGRTLSGELVTTDAVLLEVADALCAPEDRKQTARFLRSVWDSDRITVYAINRDLLERGVSLYESRIDKIWSLTDCISFVVMRDEGLTESLTGDRHFEQAGFHILF